MSAVVLGAGGLIGGAWLGGLVAGLVDGGFPLSAADQLLGTSVGAVLGAWLGNHADLSGYFDAIAARQAWQIRARTGPASFWADRLPPGPWPAALRIVAAVADSRHIAVWGREAGLSLGTALAAATAPPETPPPVRVLGRAYTDGSSRSPTTNADLAVSGIDEEDSRVLILAPVVSRRLAGEVGLLRGLGCVVTVITPERGLVLDAPGPAGALGHTLIGPAARAGREQAVRALTRLASGVTVRRRA